MLLAKLKADDDSKGGDILEASYWLIPTSRPPLIRLAVTHPGLSTARLERLRGRLLQWRCTYLNVQSVVLDCAARFCYLSVFELYSRAKRRMKVES
jgi:hypothetical protein